MSSFLTLFPKLKLFITIQVFEESQEAGADKSTEEEVTADDKGPYQLSVGDEIANVTPPEEAKDGQNIQKIPNESELKSHGDETDSTDAATKAAAQIKEVRNHYPSLP